HQVAADVVDVLEISDDAVRAGVHEQLGQEGELARAAVTPSAAVNIDVDRSVLPLAAIDVDAFDLARPVLESQRFAEDGAGDRAVGLPAGMDLVAVGGIDGLVVSVVERLLVHVEPDQRALGTGCGKRVGHWSSGPPVVSAPN